MPVMVCVPVGGGRPDNSLPDGGDGGQVDNSLPTLPNYPSNGLPSGGVIPGNRPVQLPAAPPVFPNNDLPDTVFPGFPAHPLPPVPGTPGTLPILPGTVWPPLPPILGGKKYLVVVLIPGIGARWVVIDTSLTITPMPTAK